MSNGVDRAIEELAIQLAKNNALMEEFIKVSQAKDKTQQDMIDFLKEAYRTQVKHDQTVGDKVLNHNLSRDRNLWSTFKDNVSWIKNIAFILLAVAFGLKLWGIV